MTTESLTVEQTNALRQSLGLPPLTTAPSPSPPSSSPPAPPHSDDPSDAISSLRAELARRQAARHASAVLSTASLSSQLQFSTAGSASAWIQRHRSVMEEETQRRDARRREEEARTKAGEPQYDATQLRGLRIAHSYDTFEDEAEAVLVLRDKRIGEDDDGDELVNAELDEREKRQEAAGKAGKKGWEDDDDRPTLLAKYDEDEAAREGIVLGGGGQYGRAEEERRRKAREDEERRERLVGGFGEALDGRLEYDVSSVERKVDSEYADAPPQVAFKKKKDRKREAGDGATKTRSHRRDQAEEKPADDWMRLLEEEAKRGSTNASSREEEEKARARTDEERRQKKTQGYLRALEKGEEATKRRLERDRQEEEERRQRLAIATAREAEEEDEELALAVERARRLTQREKQSVAVKVKVEGQEDGREVKVEPPSGIRALAERIASEREGAAVKREGVKAEARGAVNGVAGAEDDDDGIVFTSVSNFATGLTAPEDSRRAAREEEVDDRAAAVKRELAAAAMDVDDHKDRHPPNGAHPVTARNGSSRSHPSDDHADGDDDAEDGDGAKEEGGEDGEDDEEEDEDDIFGDEPLASGGIASALALAQRRAYISSAPSSEPAVGFNLAQYDALGRELSAKEKFRLLSHGFHGQGAGINKSDKRERSKKREVGLLQRVREKESLGVGQDNRQLLEAQRRLGQAYLVLDGAKPTGTAPTPGVGSLSRMAGAESDSRKRVKR